MGESTSMRVDISGLDVNKPLFHNNTDMKIEEDGQKILDELGSMMVQLKSLYIQTYPEGSKTTPKCRFGGPVSKYIKNQFWGISIDKHYGGVNVNP